jgi:hypothetical protein
METKIQVYPSFFARGTFLYYVLLVLIIIALLFGIFDPRKAPVNKKVIGVYGDYKVLAVKQGEDVWEITLREKNAPLSGKPILIANTRTVLWIAQKEFKIINHHLLEENGKTVAIIITVDED